MTTETISVAEELELFAQAYHAMKTLDIDQSVIDDFIEDFADQFEFSPEDETKNTYLVYMKDTNSRWGIGPEYVFESREQAIDKIIHTYQYSPQHLQQSRDSFAPNYWANTYEIRKETTTK